ncbi:MAG: DUF3341 domain-containing protein [Blastochloris sp.]|nr:DUF3341 domain-containing protein [Blastochloris sp.]
MSSVNTANACLYGVIAEFDNAKDLLNAAEKARSAGYTRMRGFTPYYVEGLSDVLGHRFDYIQWVVLLALAAGAAAGFFLQYYTDVIDYPLNIGGRPYASWQAFTILTFEIAVLVAGLVLFGAFMILNNFPLPYHPVFNAPNIELASSSHFFLVIETRDRRFDLQKTQQFLRELNPLNVSEVPC